MPEIIVHGSEVMHFDETAAIALILAMNSHIFTIARRDPTKEEIDNPNIWVVDVGKVHDPARKCFDHHQYVDGDSAFVLVAKHLGIYDDLLFAYPELAFKSMMDSSGPYKAAASIGITSKALMNTLSPIESAIFGIIGQQEIIHDDMVDLLAAIGHHWIETAYKLKNRVKLLAETVEIKRLPEGYGCLLISTIPDNPGLGINEFRRLYHEGKIETKFPRLESDYITVSLTPETRRNADDVLGKTFYRFSDHPGFDFAQVIGYPGVKFAHKAGFLAVFDDSVDTNALLKQAMVKLPNE